MIELTTEPREIDEWYNGELDPMVEDTMQQLENLRNNETVDRSPDADEFGVDRATD